MIPRPRMEASRAMEQLESLAVRHLFYTELQIIPPKDTGGGPQGRRMIVGVSGGSFEGARLRGRVVAPSGDWMTLRPNGSMKLDVRLTLVTDDEAVIHMAYEGLVTRAQEDAKVRSAPLFETGDERYAWINDVQCVGIGEVEGSTVRYQVYELL